MTNIFVNLKRFEVPRAAGGVSDSADPRQWIETVIAEVIQGGLGCNPDLNLCIILPEGLLLPALVQLGAAPAERRTRLALGAQGVYRQDIAVGGNFGAFTTLLPAASAKLFGATWALIGHSEERKDKFEILARFEPRVNTDAELRQRANGAVSALIGEEVGCARRADLNVLLCVGETAEEKGGGSAAEQRSRVEAVLAGQLETALAGAATTAATPKIVIAYEPRWAIGPGKTPPDAEYIAFVSSFIKAQTRRVAGVELPVVYGGGLKEENAAMIAGVSTLDGGLVALTRFTGQIGFYPEDLQKIIGKYLAQRDVPSSRTRTTSSHS
ncbi:MAG: triosephosphate isomerase [Verrucomicrobia bacterium]|nr:triosephosphate isomerase [Verrucomicrobiota bacterium]